MHSTQYAVILSIRYIYTEVGPSNVEKEEHTKDISLASDSFIRTPTFAFLALLNHYNDIHRNFLPWDELSSTTMSSLIWVVFYWAFLVVVLFLLILPILAKALFCL